MESAFISIGLAFLCQLIASVWFLSGLRSGIIRNRDAIKVLQMRHDHQQNDFDMLKIIANDVKHVQGELSEIKAHIRKY